MLSDDARAKFDALIEQIEHDAFQRGWDAAVKHIMSAAASAPKGIAVPSTVISAAPAATRQRAAYGAVPALVRELLAEAGSRGITPAEVVARSRERGEEIAESSVRQRLRKMKVAKEVRNARGRWFRATEPHVTVGQEDGDAPTPPSDEPGLGGGGFHAAA